MPPNSPAHRAKVVKGLSKIFRDTDREGERPVRSLLCRSAAFVRIRHNGFYLIRGSLMEWWNGNNKCAAKGAVGVTDAGTGAMRFFEGMCYQWMDGLRLWSILSGQIEGRL